MYDVIDVAGHVINRCNSRGCGISNLKLQKVLYFIQAYFLMEKGRPCFREAIEAWNFGPVVPAAYNEFKQYGSTWIPQVTRRWNEQSREFIPFAERIGRADRVLIDAVADHFDGMSSPHLVSVTQNQKPWMMAYSPYKTNEITIKSMKEYFISV